MKRAGIIAVLAALSSVVFSGTVLDDAFIFARYAGHALRYGDLVWNPDEPRIEGFSSWDWLSVLQQLPMDTAHEHKRLRLIMLTLDLGEKAALCLHNVDVAPTGVNEEFRQAVNTSPGTATLFLVCLGERSSQRAAYLDERLQVVTVLEVLAHDFGVQHASPPSFPREL